jgi:hypothetical protein
VNNQCVAEGKRKRHDRAADRTTLQCEREVRAVELPQAGRGVRNADALVRIGFGASPRPRRLDAYAIVANFEQQSPFLQIASYDHFDVTTARTRRDAVPDRVLD